MTFAISLTVAAHTRAAAIDLFKQRMAALETNAFQPVVHSGGGQGYTFSVEVKASPEPAPPLTDEEIHQLRRILAGGAHGLVTFGRYDGGGHGGPGDGR